MSVTKEKDFVCFLIHVDISTFFLIVWFGAKLRTLVVKVQSLKSMVERAMSQEIKDRTISVRIPAPLLTALDRYAELQKQDRTEVIREAISDKLNRPTRSDRLTKLDKKIAEVERQQQNKMNELECQIGEIDELYQLYCQNKPTS